MHSGEIVTSTKKSIRLSIRHFEFGINLQQVALVYSLLLALSRIGFDEMTAYISSIGLVIAPITVGFAVNVLVDWLRSSRARYIVDVRSLLGWWMFGIIVLTLFCSLTSLIAPSVVWKGGAALSLASIFLCLVVGRRAISTDLKISGKILFSLILVMVGALTAYWYLRRLSPFPLMLGSDLTAHLADVAAVLDGSKGIGLYDDGFIVLIGTSSWLAGSKVLWVFWAGPLVQYVVMATGIYLLSRKMLSNYYTPIVAAAIPLWFMGDGIISDIIFLLRRNLLMAMVPLFVLYLLHDNERSKQRPSCPFLLAGIVPVVYYFAISNAFYISTMSKLPYVVQILVQPVFVFISPLTFDMPVAKLQDLYVAAIALLILYVLTRMCKPSEKRTLISWVTITFVAILINYRMGVLLSLFFFVMLVLKSQIPSRIFLVLNMASLGVIGLIFAGADSLFQHMFNIVNQTLTETIFQVGDPVLWTLQQKTDFLSHTYGHVFVYLTFFSVFYLSHAASKKPRIVSIVTSITAWSLAMYFLPVPFPQRFLFLVTPFIVLLTMLSVETLVTNYLKTHNVHRASRSFGHKSSQRGSPCSEADHKPLKARTHTFEKLIEASSLVVILIVCGVSITGPYDFNIQNYTSMYGPTGSISSYNQYDLHMASWLEDHMPGETLIISDPTTVQILSGLAGIPYTLKGRYLANGLTSLSMISGRSDLFRKVLSSLDAKSLIELINLFDVSDSIRGVNSLNRRIITIVNNRTVAWLAGSAGYEYASSFQTFPGLVYLSRSSFSRSLYNASSTYLAYELSVPTLTTTKGPQLSVQFSNSSVHFVTTTMTYYDFVSPDYALSLSGSEQYMVEGIPLSWLLESIEAPKSATLNITQSSGGRILRIEKVIPDHQLEVHWKSYGALGNPLWKFVEWQDGWQAGPYSSPGTGVCRFSAVGGMLKLNLSAGVANGYSSVLWTRLSLPVNEGTSFFLRVNGTENAKLAVAVDLTDYRRVFLFNSTPTFFQLQPEFQTIQDLPKLGDDLRIEGIQIFILSTDGLPCESFIKYLFTAEQS